MAPTSFAFLFLNHTQKRPYRGQIHSVQVYANHAYQLGQVDTGWYTSDFFHILLSGGYIYRLLTQ